MFRTDAGQLALAIEPRRFFVRHRTAIFQQTVIYMTLQATLMVNIIGGLGVGW